MSSNVYDHEWVVEYSRAHETARSTGDYEPLVEASRTIVRRVLELALTRMGESTEKRMSVLRTIIRAQELVPDHLDAFPNTSNSGPPHTPLQWMYRAIWWLEKAERSGGQVVLPADAYYRDIDHLALEVVDSVVSLLAALTVPEPRPVAPPDPVEMVGRDWIDEYQRTRQAARLSGDHVVLVEHSNVLVRRAIDLVLVRMGEQPDERELRKAIRRVQEGLFFKSSGVFPNESDAGSPKMALDRIYRATWWLEKAQLSEGRIALPDQADYRDMDDLTHDLLESVSALLLALSEPAPSSDLRDFEEGKRMVRQGLASGLPPGETMRRIIDRLREKAPTGEWEVVETLPFEGEVDDKRSFLLDVFPADASLPAPEAFDFVIGTPIRDGLATYDVDVLAGLSYDPEDSEWPSVPEWQPRDSWLRSRVLSELYDIGKRTGSLDVGAQVVALAHALVLARELGLEFKKTMGLERIGVCAGFAADTSVHLGWL